MKEEIEQNPENPEIEKGESISAEKKQLFDKASKKIKKDKESMKLLPSIKGFREAQEEADTKEMKIKGPQIFIDVLIKITEHFPTITDMEKELRQKIMEDVEKKYKESSIKTIIESLGPIYEKFGAPPSEENKNRILKNLQELADLPVEIQKEFGLSQYGFLEENLKAAIHQNLSVDEAKEIINEAEQFLEKWQKNNPRLEPEAETENYIELIKEKAGLIKTKEYEVLPEEEIEIPRDEEKPEPEREIIKLKNEIKEFEYPGEPVDIYLPGSKRLQIIYIGDRPNTNIDYLLIDPDNFDINDLENSQYKGIREKSFTFGTKYSYRFKNLPDDISATQFRIGITKKGKLFIEDCSESGTLLELPAMEE